MKLYEIVDNYMKEHNLSIRDFSELSGLSHQYVNNLRKGVNNYGKPVCPTVTTIKALSKATGISVQELMLATDDKVIVPESDLEEDGSVNLSRLLDMCSEDERMQVIAIARRHGFYKESDNAQE